MLKKRRMFKIIGIAAIVIAIVLGLISLNKSNEIVLEFGMFTGSGWDVANANSYILIDKAIAQFEQEHPNVKIHYYSGVSKDDYSEWFARKLLQGKEPDIFMILGKDFNQFCSMGVMKNLDSLIREDKNFNSNDYFTSAYQAGQYEKTQYALPYETVPMLMFVNKTLLNNEGITMPDYEWTWEDMYSICEKVTKDKNGDGILDQYGIYNFNWVDAVYTNSGKIFDRDGKQCYFENENMVESIKYIKKLNDLSLGERMTQEDFNNGRVAFMPLSFAEYRTYKIYPYRIKRYSDFQWECITMPAGNKGDNVSRVNSLLMGISANTKHEELAWDFLKLMTYDEEIQTNIFRYSQGASVLKNVTQSNKMEEIVRENLEEGDTVISGDLLGYVIENGHINPSFRKYDQALAFANDEINKIVEDEKTVDSSLKILQRAMDDYLND